MVLRAYLWLFLVFPAFAQPDDLVGTLARRIVPMLGGGSVALTFTNLSGMSPADVLQVRRRLEDRLPVAEKGAALRVTLSENPRDWLLTAETMDGRVVIASVEKPAAELRSSRLIPRIEVEKLFESPRRILDFVLVDDGLWVLELETLSIYRRQGVEWALDRTIALPDVSPRDRRDARGGLRVERDSFHLGLPHLACIGSIPPSGVSCTPELDSGQTSFPDEVGIDNPDCGVPRLVLATGRGDYSVPDTIRAWQATNQEPVPLGDPVQVPGPVLVLRPGSAVIRNLNTGFYEALRVSVDCAR